MQLRFLFFQSNINIGGNQPEMLSDNWHVWNATWIAIKNCLVDKLVRQWVDVFGILSLDLNLNACT